MDEHCDCRICQATDPRCICSHSFRVTMAYFRSANFHAMQCPRYGQRELAAEAAYYGMEQEQREHV